MNNPAITKEELLNVALEIIKRDGLESLNIRLVAKECNISVGCIYNYFPSKSELILAIIEEFWNTIINKSSFDKVKSNDFIDLIYDTYNRLYFGLKEFTSDFLNQMSILKLKDKEKGKEIEAEYWKHMKMEMLQVLNMDTNISSKVWNETMTKSNFVDFVFDNMMISLRKGIADCTFLIELIKCILYR